MSTNLHLQRSRQPRIAVVDDPASRHGRIVAPCARVGPLRAEVVWVAPDLALPERLRRLKGVHALAVPLGVHGAGPRDRFTNRLLAEFAQLNGRGIPVLVAAGSHGIPNFLGTGGTPVGPVGASLPAARLRVRVARTCGSSGAAVRAAALIAVLRSRRGHFTGRTAQSHAGEPR
jgi:hypothetical protein